MTINPYPKELTAPLKGTLRLKLIQKGHIFPVHIPVVDLSDDDEMRAYLLGLAHALGQELEDYEVPLMSAAVFLCLN